MSNHSMSDINEKQLVRAFEVARILGGNVPEDYVVKTGRIDLLSDSEKKQDDFIVCNGKTIQVKFHRNDHYYSWWSYYDDDVSIREILMIDYACLEAEYYQSEHATETSGFFLYNDWWGSPKIYCNLDRVSIDVEEKQQSFPFDYYYDLFVTYMKSKKDGNALANNPEVVNTIIEIFGSLIQNHVRDLQSNDQSWRFEVEKMDILSQYYDRIRYDKEHYKKAVEEAYEQLKNDLHLSEDIKNDSLKELESLQQKYGHGAKS